MNIKHATRQNLTLPSHLFLLLCCLLSFTTVANAQRSRGRGYSSLSPTAIERNLVGDTIESSAKRFAYQIDSLAIVAHTYFPPAGGGQQTIAHLSNPYYFPLFSANTLLRTPIHTTIGTLAAPSTQGTDSLGTSGHLQSLLPAPVAEISKILSTHYTSRPDLISYNLAPNNYPSNPYIKEGSARSNSKEKELGEDKPTSEWQREASQAANSPAAIVKEKHHEDEVLDLSDFHIHVRRPNFWKVKGQFSTQFMQYYVSENWYKGGENYVSMLGIFNIEANYDNKQKITFANNLETKLGFQTSPHDTQHSFKTNADLIRLTDKLGIKARNHWYYTFMLQSWTQFYKAFKPNAEEVASDFMSPFTSILSVGMDYKLEKKRVNLTATISPGAANFKYCDRSSIVTNHGIEEGKHYKIDLGSTCTFKMTLKLCEQVNWVTRLYAFYDYKDHLTAEWENTVNLKINKYLSTKLFLYPRWDNTAPKRDDKYSYLQFNEYLSVGLDLNF